MGRIGHNKTAAKATAGIVLRAVRHGARAIGMGDYTFMDDLQKFKEMDIDEANAYLEDLNGCSHDCSSCGGCSEKVTKPAKTVIAVIGGKGGTGKSTVTALLASALAREGLKTGILDADISGASIPQILGIAGPPGADEVNFLPLKTREGISVMSMALISEKSDEPIIWPSADMAKIAVYLWTGTSWGDLDVLLVDMPSGTGDTPLEYFTTLPIDKTIAVTTPGELSALMVKRAVNLSRMLMLPVMGIIENFSGDNAEDRIRAAYGDTPLLAAIPYDPALKRAADSGSVGGFEAEGLAFLARAIAEGI